jgi:hypothetical protein
MQGYAVLHPSNPHGLQDLSHELVEASAGRAAGRDDVWWLGLRLMY